MRVLLTRHGDAQGTKGKFHGLKDDPMTSKGRSEIYQLAPRLARYNPIGIVYSPLSRTRDSAQILSEELGIPAYPSRALLPLDLGHFVGKSTETHADGVRFYLAHPWEQIPGGGTVEGWARQYLPTFERYLASKGTGTIIFMTHGRNIVLSHAYMKGGRAAPSYNWKALVDNTDATEHGGFAVAEPNQFRIVTPKHVAKGLS